MPRFFSVSTSNWRSAGSRSPSSSSRASSWAWRTVASSQQASIRRLGGRGRLRSGPTLPARDLDDDERAGGWLLRVGRVLRREHLKVPLRDLGFDTGPARAPHPPELVPIV